MLGNYLRRACQGDVRRLAEIGLSSADRLQGGHACRLVHKYEQWLDEGPALSLLRLLGLFDQPAEMGAIQSLCDPPIHGLTEQPDVFGEQDWNLTIATLRDCGLLSGETVEDSSFALSTGPSAPRLDAHPIVRAYFAEQLSERDDTLVQSAHRRLYQHYQQVPAKFHPDTLEDMLPLYHAVRHGCAAGEYWDAYETVYLQRIRRSRDENYSWSRLGAFGQDLAVLACFFERCWDRPAPSLTEQQKAIVLNLAGLLLRELGRVGESLAPVSDS